MEEGIPVPPSHFDVLSVVLALCFPFLLGFIAAFFFIASLVVMFLLLGSMSLSGVFFLSVCLIFGIISLLFSHRMFKEIHIRSMEPS